jgi:phosphoribosylglycinamide formyltransferase-1
MSEKLSLGVLASGSGSNLQALLDACADGRVPARVAVVISNVPSARALERARAAGVPAVLIPHKGERQWASREEYDAALVEALRAHSVQLVCLAGYMRLVSPVLLRAFEDKILNIHPALLPSFPGLHAQRQALAAGVRVSGCTVHVVDEGCDTGPIVLQAAVPVLAGDTEATLSARILAQEHRCYVRAVQLFAQGRARVVAEGGRKRVHIDAAQAAGAAALASPALEDAP